MLTIKINKNIFLKKEKNKLLISGPTGNLKINIIKEINIIIGSEIILIQSEKIKYLNLYNSLIKQKLKGAVQFFRKSIFLSGVGYKFIFDKNCTSAFKLKTGYSNLIYIKIPEKYIKIISYKKNCIIFESNDLEILTRFIYFIKNFKKPDVYKGKGLFLKNEQIVLKEIKKSKK